MFKLWWLLRLKSFVEIVLAKQTFEHVISLGVNLLVLTSHGLATKLNLFFVLIV